MRIRSIVLCLGLGAAGFALTAHAAGAYTVTVLQDAGGGPISQPYAINASGQALDIPKPRAVTTTRFYG
jgi:hypothetical protein